MNRIENLLEYYSAWPPTNNPNTLASFIFENPQIMFFNVNYFFTEFQQSDTTQSPFLCIPFLIITALSPEDRSILLQFHKVLIDIKSETVVGKLVQAGVLTHEEKNSINLAPRNPDRMKALLALLPKKSTNALNAFCEAIKYRYTSIYDQLCKARLQAQSKPGKYHKDNIVWVWSIFSFLNNKLCFTSIADDISECCTYLKSKYKKMYNQFNMISWHPQVTCDLCDFYVTPHISDFYG